VHEVGRGRGVQERSLEAAMGWKKVMETGSRVAHVWKNVRESLSRLSINEVKLATNRV